MLEEELRPIIGYQDGRRDLEALGYLYWGGSLTQLLADDPRVVSMVKFISLIVDKSAHIPVLDAVWYLVPWTQST